MNPAVPAGTRESKVHHWSSLPEVLRQRAALTPTGTAYVFLDEQGEEVAALTYAELHARALAVARELARLCAPGDRALLVFPSGLDFVVAYFGCLYAHVLAVPVNPPRRNRVQDATRSVVRDCAPAAVLTVTAMLDAIRPQLDADCGTLHWLPVDAVGAGGGDAGQDVAGGPWPAESVAFLQYTSGSTAQPKGVLVTHGNLVANQEMIRRSFGHDERSTVVGWAPLFHDQGLIGNVLQPLYVGATCVLMSPMTFLRRPLLWLSVISRYRAHTSGGPNFAFDACTARAERGEVPELDLSCWKVAFNGAEPVRPATLLRFAELFAPSGFAAEAMHPCYGLAEATLLVTGSRKGRAPRLLEADVDELARRRCVPAPPGKGRVLAGSGLVDPDEVRIVDPDTGRPCPPGHVGEVWVTGAHVSQGYWRLPGATAETFHAECAGEPGPRHLRTGDLGTVVDGELYVVGRLKDVIVLRGRNHHPHDIEHTVAAAHPALQPGAGAAFAVPGPDGDRLVVVQEIRRDHRRTAAVAEVTAAVRAALAQEHGLSAREVVLTTPGRLPKTSSGKIRRTAARERYLQSGFDTWAPAPPGSGQGDQQGGSTMDAATPANPDYADAVRKAVLSMPAAKHLGFEFGRIAPGEVEIVQPYRAELTQHDGYFQGGVLGALADFAGGSAAGTLLPAGWVNMTIDYTVKILAPAKGERLVVHGRVVKAGPLMTVAAADVHSVTGPEETAPEETLCATALVTMRNVRPGRPEGPA